MSVDCQTCGSALPDGANFCPNCGRLVQAAPAAAPGKGFPRWIIVLLVVVALFFVSIPFIAIVAAIAIPNFIHARAESVLAADKGNMRQISTALEEYAVDHNDRYPDDLSALVPKYITVLPPVPGTDSTGSYSYHHPASSPLRGTYDIWDDGSMDPTLLQNLPRDPAYRGNAQECKYVIYAQAGGFMCTPGRE